MQLVEMMPFAVELGIELDSASPDEVVGRMSWAPERCTAGGVLHGGALMTLADSLGAVCAYLNLATSRPLHVGRSVIVVQTELRDDGAKLVGQVTQAQAVLGQ